MHAFKIIQNIFPSRIYFQQRHECRGAALFYLPQSSLFRWSLNQFLGRGDFIVLMTFSRSSQYSKISNEKCWRYETSSKEKIQRKTIWMHFLGWLENFSEHSYCFQSLQDSLHINLAISNFHSLTTILPLTTRQKKPIKSKSYVILFSVFC